MLDKKIIKFFEDEFLNYHDLIIKRGEIKKLNPRKNTNELDIKIKNFCLFASVYNNWKTLNKNLNFIENEIKSLKKSKILPKQYLKNGKNFKKGDYKKLTKTEEKYNEETKNKILVLEVEILITKTNIENLELKFKNYYNKRK